MNEALPLACLKDFADLRMGETIIAADCTDDGLPVYSADTSDAPWNFSSRCRVVNRRGCIVIGARGSIGHPRLPAYDEFAATQTTIVVDPNRTELYPPFLLYALRMVDFKLVSAQQAVPMLTIGDLRKVQIPKPAQSEQRRIAEILGAVDEVIEQTEALIAKHQQVKAGLMHDLFTRGLTPDGRLRATRAEAPDLYRNSSLGPIPKEWAVCLYGEVCERVSVGIATSTTNHFAESGVPILRNQNIRSGYIDLSDVLKITREFDTLNRSKRLRSGDVITVRTGYPGTSAVVPAQLEGWQTFTTLISTPLSDRITSEFLCELLNSHLGRTQIARLQGGGAQQNLNVGWLVNFVVPLPSLEEQRRISDSLKITTEKETIENANLAKLRKLKQGLMQELLTGRVQVPA